jgi:hypothetical protein
MGRYIRYQMFNDFVDMISNFKPSKITQTMKQSDNVIGVGPHTNNLTININYTILYLGQLQHQLYYIILFLENDKITLKLLFSQNKLINK